MSYSIAIDGPAGAGKSTIAKKIAKKLNFIYVDTGAMYRAMALFMIQKQVDREAEELIGTICKEADITIVYENGEQQVILNGSNVTKLLRTEEAGKMASFVAKNKNVRKKLVDLQQKMAKTTDVIMDGRDIGTCVLPEADVKIYLTASSKERALRRYKELVEKGVTCDLDEIEKDIIARDEQDMNREVSPLKKAEDAILVDSSNMTIDEVVERIIDIFRKKMK
ncbi:(d)CMP kinase [Velocimicrobium porci]|uniref:Cytidylate kinase n=1 Tax=Velocimicrobium porci TaxID=2606634 RepID=A0A6L5XWZ0_9FIRM|nr:(d)CMP kinase [Velocimicrobium porci]MSS63356.1 (d)CMP kinase [Velocimicrobium porci]